LINKNNNTDQKVKYIFKNNTYYVEDLINKRSDSIGVNISILYIVIKKNGKFDATLIGIGDEESTSTRAKEMIKDMGCSSISLTYELKLMSGKIHPNDINKLYHDQSAGNIMRLDHEYYNLFGKSIYTIH
jgi:hypothetical protein